MWPTYFLGVVRNHVSLGSPNHNLHTRSYRGILCMYLWYSKKKGVNVGNPQHKNTVLESVLCCHDREMSAKSADIWLLGWHVADMSPAFPAKEGEMEGEVEEEEGEEDCWAVLVIVISIILNQDTVGKLWSRAFYWCNKNAMVSLWNNTLLISKGTKYRQ